MKSKIIVAALLLFTTPSFASDNSRLSLVGGVNYGGLNSVTASAGPITATSKGGIGFAVGALRSFNSFEIGFLYINRSYSVETNAGTGNSSTSSGVFHIPLLYRFGNGGTTFGLGAFAEGGNGSDYGLLAGPRFGGSQGGWFVDARFLYSLKSGNDKNVLGLIGYGFR